MKDTVKTFPQALDKITTDASNVNFDQLSEPLLGSFLATIAAMKTNGRFIELGTGCGFSTAWILHGMDANSSLISIDTDENLTSIATKHLGNDKRLKIIVGAGAELISSTRTNSIDFIFADAWDGKYHHTEETLALLKVGGIYIVDDMLPQENWPTGHAKKADALVRYLESRNDFHLTKMSWSSGIIICTKKHNEQYDNDSLTKAE